MNVERLQEVLRQVRQELSQTDIEARLTRLEPILQQVVAQPGVPDFQKQVTTQLDEIQVALERAPSTEYGPVWEHSVQELRLGGFLGPSLLNHVVTIFSRNQITPAVALQEIQQLKQAITDVRSRIDQVLAGLEFLGISPRQIPAEKAEVGILIPRSAVDNNLAEFGSEVQDLNRDVNAIAEAVTGHAEDVQIQEVSSSEIIVYVLVASTIAERLARALSVLIGCYKQILEIRALRDQLKTKGLSGESLAPIEQHASQIMDESIRAESQKLVKESPVETTRRNELKNLVSKALWRFARRLDEGYNFDVRASESPSASQDEAESKAAESIREVRKSLDFINVTGERILQLPPGIESNSKDETPKQTRATKSESEAKGPGSIKNI
jgi:hypothetical protein